MKVTELLMEDLAKDEETIMECLKDCKPNYSSLHKQVVKL